MDDPLIVDTADVGIDSELLDIGRPFEGWSDQAWIGVSKVENDGTPDDVLQNHLGLPIYSPRLRAALESAGIHGIQFLPVRLLTLSGQELAGFAIANIVERRSALDRSRSDYDTYPDDFFLPDRRGKVRGLRRVVLLKVALVGCDVFRLDEFPFSIYVSERFKEIFDAGRFTGYSFREVDLS